MVESTHHANTAKDEQTSRLSRRNFLKAGVAAVMATAMREHDNIQRPPYTPAPKIELPKNITRDLEERFKDAFAELDSAIHDSMRDVKDLRERYGMLDLSAIKKGINVQLLPPYKAQPTRCQLSLEAKPNEVHTLAGFAKLVDACVKLESLYYERNLQNRKKPPESLDYKRVAKKMAHSYSLQNKDNADAKNLEFIALVLIENTMRNVGTYDEVQRTPEEMRSANQQFLKMLEKYKDYGHVYPDGGALHRPDHIAFIVLTEEETKEHGRMTMISDQKWTNKHGVDIPLPDQVTLDCARKLPLNDIQKLIVANMDDRLKENASPKQQNSLPLSVPDPDMFGLSRTEIMVTIDVLNPALHANRVAMDTAERQR